MRCLVLLMLLPSTAFADTVIALRRIPAQAVVSAADLNTVDAAIAGAATDVALVIGQEARVTIYAGRPVFMSDFGPAALINRNQRVSLIYIMGDLQISVEGRALGRGGAGDTIRAMNLASRNAVSGIVTETGAIRVGPIP